MRLDDLVETRLQGSFLTTLFGKFLAYLASFWKFGLAKIAKKLPIFLWVFPFRVVGKVLESDICHLICHFRTITPTQSCTNHTTSRRPTLYLL